MPIFEKQNKIFLLIYDNYNLQLLEQIMKLYYICVIILFKNSYAESVVNESFIHRNFSSMLLTIAILFLFALIYSKYKKVNNNDKALHKKENDARNDEEIESTCTSIESAESINKKKLTDKNSEYFRKMREVFY